MPSGAQLTPDFENDNSDISHITELLSVLYTLSFFRMVCNKMADFLLIFSAILSYRCLSIEIAVAHVLRVQVFCPCLHFLSCVLYLKFFNHQKFL